MVSLFSKRTFRSRLGEILTWKINCDALSNEDIEVLACLIAEIVKFSSVEGVPTGGARLAQALEKYKSKGSLLIVDDVLTTGFSMEAQRSGREAIGVVIFSCCEVPPSWVIPLFSLLMWRKK